MGRVRRTGDEKAFDVLYRRYARRLHGFFFRMLGREEQLAADFTQELFLRVWAARGRYECGRELCPWFFTMAYNLCRNEYRFRNIAVGFAEEVRGGPDTYEEQPELRMDVRMFDRELSALLDKLPPEQRVLFALRYEEELTVPQLAEVLGLLTGRKGIDAERLVKPSVTVEPLEENRRPELSLYESQRQQLSVQEKGLTARYMPKLGVFAQGAYGDPGLNMLKGGFEPYYIAGVRLSWNISDLYTRKNDKRLLAASRDDIDVQEAVFRLNNRMETAQQWRTVEKIDTLMKNDDELIRLRTNIRKSAEAKVANGTLTVTEMLREVTAEDQAKQTKAMHEIQRLQALYDIKYTMNH